MAVVQPADPAVKANEILARFRPIAPKPTLAAAAAAAAAAPMAQAAADGVVAANRVLCQLQSRPCRARKRGRPTVVPPPAMPPKSPGAKRKSAAAPPYPPLRCAAATDAVVATATRAHVSVVVPGSSACLAGEGLVGMKVAVEERDVPVERDLLRKLLEPKVISPRAVRPVCSTIYAECIRRRRTDASSTAAAAISKTAAEVEAELEGEALPAVVSDSSNRVRLVNDAYKEMVGQPECPWLDAVAALSRRISGEVVLVVADESSLPESYDTFTCAAKIEWEYDGKLSSVSAPCDVRRLQCESRDYLFTWRFRTADADASVGRRSSETSDS
ncbi:hypothetical protein HU200_054823 [Digitaria exilis]|uniref:DUF7950 domain-containing protein n=1 Tax=Digitaria exilis TaxID=1010633 RepID=A0A835AUF8_9POAL|nr:hypothetical protein HU200_054823 [Digitaria exilis]CAB3458458.1 unnamed protein product [Digitaria exilis]